MSDNISQLLNRKLSEPVYFKVIPGSTGPRIEEICYLRTEGLAALLGIDIRTVRAWVLRGTVPYYKPPGSSIVLFELNEIVRWIESTRQNSMAS